MLLSKTIRLVLEQKSNKKAARNASVGKVSAVKGNKFHLGKVLINVDILFTLNFF